MKTMIAYAIATFLAIALVVAFAYGMRLFSNVATPITVHEVEPNIHCAAGS